MVKAQQNIGSVGWLATIRTAQADLHKNPNTLEKTKKYYEQGRVEGAEWPHTSSREDLEFASTRETVAEAVENLGEDAHPYDLHGASPLMQGDFEGIVDYFEMVYYREDDFDFESSQEFDELGVFPQIPNVYFRAYEQGWTESVRAHWNSITAKSRPWETHLPIDPGNVRL